ncbi:bifunctional serine/threonine-protein kinase/universal stress protein [Sediminicoccus sp. KRV36]|uniref:serine/threonine protein kinase n=1 Tax=Sediminicoccus sp. KRV36 TaxID=3133721 RepID=UPI00200E0C54|nr:bifunctional serine/threonine-protein kinase/universal stress protein [Sediminicoccus rosea]UPY36192.1 bifunctional serine/threonine-protein kinase/universal stress protein [Sediminicoccus rosea]
MRTGTVIGGFTLGPEVHRGGMAVLHEATHPDHAIPMLMKLPLLAEGEDPAAIVSFEMEQMIMPRLDGPHVPRCLGVGHEPLPWIAMEHIQGETLLPLLERLPLPIAEVVEVGALIAEALCALHRQGVVHLDVKPGNLMRVNGPGGRIVLLDFGLSRHAHLPDLMAEEFRLPYGSAPYMAPEQLIGVRGDPASDLFALAALLYELTTGRSPFGDPQHMGAMKRRIWWDPPPPRALRPDCPPWLQEVILRNLEVEPGRRNPTAAQMAFDLRHPEQVSQTARSARLKRDPWSARIRRRFHPDHQPQLRRNAIAMAQSGAPIIAVALDLDDMPDGLGEALRGMVTQIMATLPGARVACVNVLRTHLLRPDLSLDEVGRNKHLQRLLELRHWSASLNLPEARLTHHVLEAMGAATALLEYAQANRVDHLILGARSPGLARRVLGSVAAEVARDAPCSVTVVRLRPG